MVSHSFSVLNVARSYRLGKILRIGTVVDMTPIQKTVGIEQAQEGLGEYRFSGAGFTDNRQALALVDIQTDIANRMQNFSAQTKLDIEIFYR